MTWKTSIRETIVSDEVGATSIFVGSPHSPTSLLRTPFVTLSSLSAGAFLDPPLHQAARGPEVVCQATLLLPGPSLEGPHGC